MLHEVVVAGFGGQGVMLIGQLLCYAGMMEGKNVSWIPSYGPEMRGGTANCGVVVSDAELGSPVVTEPSALIAMNRPSLERFEADLQPGGLLVYNSSLIQVQPTRADIRVVAVPANEIAADLGNDRVANMVILGAFIAASAAVTPAGVERAMRKNFQGKKADLIPVNLRALEHGMALAQAAS